MAVDVDVQRFLELFTASLTKTLSLSEKTES